MINIPARLLSCEPHSLHILGCASSPTFLRCEPHSLLSFVTYSATFLRLSFAYPSLNLRSTFAEGLLKG